MSSVIRHHTVLGGGHGNWFGDGSDGDIKITAAGAEQSFDDGSTWTAISGWELNAVDRYAPDAHSGNVVTIPSVQDGDMVVVNALSLTIESGCTLTTKHRCRGLIVYCLGNLTVDGILSMTARGCHANPADAVVTSNTPVAPTDGNAVPIDGIVIRRLAEGYTDVNTDDDLMFGCGNAAVESESNQPVVDGNGVVFKTPRVGGLGALPGYGGLTNDPATGEPGREAENAPGGGGTGGVVHSVNRSGYGGDATCFSGGVGTGGIHATACGIVGADADDYGGPGGDGEYFCGAYPYGAGGAGNKGGLGCSPGSAGHDGSDGTGGWLFGIARGDFIGSGSIESKGRNGGNDSAGAAGGGGGSGGGLAGILHGGDVTFTGSFDVSGGLGGPGNCSAYYGGPGGDGSVIGPQKIDQ